MNAFYTHCHAAGPADCAFYAPTPELIAANLTALYASVSARPLPVRTATSYGLVDYNRLRMSVFTSLYQPWKQWPVLANALADLARGDGAALYAMLETPLFECECGGGEDLSAVRDAGTAIACNDGDVVPDSFEELEKYFKDTTCKSEWAELWGGIRTSCVAKKTAKGFPGAVVLTQDSPGKYIGEYFRKGTLPPAGTVCSVSGSPFPRHDAAADPTDTQAFFGSGGDQADESVVLSTEDQLLLDAVKKLSTSYGLPLLHV
ncbi:hypothetical protein H0H81_001674 [Sphagnurus paluster]|uniref:Uncharacterized protein n=1 Tax=Sphagnurus paluster TaxID=117069 RepID=A0A9P7FPP3_9AGAR|nr:hypothetical protein H0H81_001674 [Sphagnurus paluster]